MLRLFLFTIVFCVVALPARADYFLWEDPKTGLTITFPDTWKTTHNQDPWDILTLLGPSDNGHPKCVVKARSDKRYVIFPPRYGRHIQNAALSLPFWKMYLGDYQDYEIANVYDGAGLGRWHASYALAGYTNNDGRVFEKRRAVMFASLYYDTMYILECSALEHAYDDWYPQFMGIVKSVDFKKTYNEIPTGHYRDFLKDADKLFWQQGKPFGVITY